eukprot:6508196-Pyramimonas_sp.AAC.1
MAGQDPDQLDGVGRKNPAIPARYHDDVVTGAPNLNVVPNQVLQTDHDQDLRIDAQSGLNPIVTRKVWAAVYKLSAPLLNGVVGAA